MGIHKAKLFVKAGHIVRKYKWVISVLQETRTSKSFTRIGFFFFFVEGQKQGRAR